MRDILGQAACPIQISNKNLFLAYRPKGGRSSTPLSSSLHSFPPPFRLLSPLPLSTPPPPRPWWRSPPYRLSAPAAWLAAAPPPLPPPSPSRAARSRPRPPGKVPMAAPSPLLISAACCEWSCGIGNGLVPQLSPILENHRVEVIMLVPNFRSLNDPSMCYSEACWKRGRQALNLNTSNCSFPLTKIGRNEMGWIHLHVTAP